VANNKLFFATEKSDVAIQRLLDSGKARRVAPGIYSSDMRSDPAALIRTEWVRVLQYLYPGGVHIADRSALSGRPDSQGNLWVVVPGVVRPRPRQLPGFNVIPRAGQGPLDSDVQLAAGVTMSGPGRAIVENVVGRGSSRIAQRQAGTLQLHRWIDNLCAQTGRAARLKTQAQQVAAQLGVVVPQQDFDIWMPAGTPQAPTDNVAPRRRRVDQQVLEYVQATGEAARRLMPQPAVAPAADHPARAVLPFFESYFSNYIEGTRFALDEAKAIVETGREFDRHQDAHDILGVYRLVSDPKQISMVPDNPQQYVELMLQRHAEMMSQRPEAHPGQFKIKNNQAGTAIFTDRRYVPGTLLAGVELIEAEDDPFVRSQMAHVLVSQTHPFQDGNGRIARITMNSELEAGGLWRICLTNAMRDNYLSSLRALRNGVIADPHVRLMQWAQKYTSQIDWSSFSSAQTALESTGAMEPTDPYQAQQLMLPQSVKLPATYQLLSPSAPVLVRCGGTNKTGRPCGIWLRPGSRCPVHRWLAPLS
jgi:hypothetical protein